MTSLQRVCVFCGSSPGAIEDYTNAARALGTALVERGLGLVYGGAHVGLMGVIADTVLAAGGEVAGVIPQGLVDKEIAHTGLSELHVVSSMHERKATMARLADGFVALPGGFGTLEELFEVLTWAQLGMHDKPCALLDVSGYFEGLLRFIDHAVDQQFIAPRYRELVLVESHPDALLDRMAAYQPPQRERWLDAEST